MRILIADDDNVFRYSLEKLLNKWGYEVFAARDGKEALEILAGECTPSLALLDWMMPEMSGAEVCREIRMRNLEPYVYVIFLTGRGDKQDTINGLAAGADDYLVKPFDSGELKARLMTGERIIGLQSDLLSARKEMEFQATHDTLTGLWNRKAIMEHFRGELVRAQRRKTPLTVIMADLDHFKKVNDTYGHLAGDAVLREVARRMHASLRPYDGIGRYGGEEFLVVASETGMEAAKQLAERLRESVGGSPVIAREGVIRVTLSLGVSVTEDVEEIETDDLLRAADTALYAAKDGGRNRTELVLAPQSCGPWKFQAAG